jgi:hypothetical protein
MLLVIQLSTVLVKYVIYVSLEYIKSEITVMRGKIFTAQMAYSARRGIDPLIPIKVSGYLHAPAALARESPRYPLKRR